MAFPKSLKFQREFMSYKHLRGFLMAYNINIKEDNLKIKAKTYIT